VLSPYSGWGGVKLAVNLLVTCRVVPLPLNPYPILTLAAYCSNLKMEAKYFSETVIAMKKNYMASLPRRM